MQHAYGKPIKPGQLWVWNGDMSYNDGEHLCFLVCEEGRTEWQPKFSERLRPTNTFFVISTDDSGPYYAKNYEQWSWIIVLFGTTLIWFEMSDMKFAKLISDI